MNKSKIFKIIVAAVILMFTIVLLGLITPNTSMANNGDNDSKSNYSTDIENDIYGSFMTEIYPVIVGEKINFKDLPTDSIQPYLNKILDFYPNISPTVAFDSMKITSKFGRRINPTNDSIRTYSSHQGVDIKSVLGAKVKSTMSGRVKYAKKTGNKYAYGNYIVIINPLGFETLYAHLNNIYVKEGQYVTKRQIIGTVGRTGNATGPNLHYEVHQAGELKDPLSALFIRFKNDLSALK
jgi:murein DD-endopeptidase MepM/ murein hydrolase activator NlpD